MLWRTAFGLRLRSCGESPVAAESLGVNVYTYKYIAVIVSGALAGLGGAFLAIVAANIYREGQTGGRGYIGLAAMIFGNWRPGGLARRRPVRLHRRAAAARRRRAVHALLLLRRRRCSSASALWQLLRRRRVVGGVVALVGRGVSCRLVPRHRRPCRTQFTGMTPYVTTLLVLALASQRLRMPAADGCLPQGRGALMAKAEPDGRLGPSLREAATRGHAAGLRAVLAIPGRRGRAGRRRPRRRRAATSRTPPTAWRCAPSAAWSRRCTRPAAAGWSRWPAWTATATR